ncbi:hypothetical protein Cadr_000026548 [Camelus dromedarius]|uniref:Uncharacterized protein n=1 Tax=Camelus dromedarius TaxID=9838 RepID=A0A5N4CGX5_CAMDR|nr:hypothetical protein Cadr_000026548 [Camelus dromedarius]
MKVSSSMTIPSTFTDYKFRSRLKGRKENKEGEDERRKRKETPGPATKHKTKLWRPPPAN